MKLITTNLLNRFWKTGIKPIKTLIGSTDISKIGATVTAAVSKLQEDITKLNTDLGSKQDAKTAINTSNIGKQSVNYAASAGSAVDQTARNAISSKTSILVYNHTAGSAEIGYTQYGTSVTVPNIRIDKTTEFSLIPSKGTYTIVNLQPILISSQWYLQVTFFADGKSYIRKVVLTT